MSKTGQARVFTPEQFAHLLGEIKEHRYPGKITALVQISFKLGLQVQEIALLQIKDVAELGPGSSVLVSALSNLRKSSRCLRLALKVPMPLKRFKSRYQRRGISFSVHDFHQLVQRIDTMAKAGAEIKPEDFYP